MGNIEMTEKQLADTRILGMEYNDDPVQYLIRTRAILRDINVSPGRHITEAIRYLTAAIMAEAELMLDIEDANDGNDAPPADEESITYWQTLRDTGEEPSVS